MDDSKWVLSFIYVFFFQQTTGFLVQWVYLPSQKTSTSYNASLIISPHEEETQIDQEFSLTLTFRGSISTCVNLTWTSEPKTITTLPEGPEKLCPIVADGSYHEYDLEVFHEGIVTIIAEVSPEILDTTDAFITVSAMLSPALNILSDICGWIYTIAWDFSFLPQIIHNWRRKSVIGLSFDYVTFNFIGFASYFVYNAGIYWSDEIQGQYEERNPNAVLHVRINDVMFPLYAVACTAIVIVQCFIYERGGQRVSWTCRIISSLLVVSEMISLILVFVIEDYWSIDFLYWCSYVKLIITCVKYVPQLYLNYKNQSTDGWSIWNVILDFTGGFFSLIQMFLLAANYDDWKSILLDPTKLGLGILSIFFNIFFLIQHYVLYRHTDSHPVKQIPTEHTPICEK